MYIRNWQASHSRMVYTSQRQALRPPIHEYSWLACAIREWEVIRDWTRTHNAWSIHPHRNRVDQTQSYSGW